MGPRSLLALLALVLAAGWFALAHVLESGRDVRAAEAGAPLAMPDGRDTLLEDAGSLSGTSAPTGSGDPGATAASTARKTAPQIELDLAPEVELGFQADAIYATVQDAEGEPLADVRVHVFTPARFGGEAQLQAELVTDAAGRFWHGPVTPHEPLTLLLEREGRVPLTTSHLPGVDREFELERGAVLGGRALDAATGQPLPGVVVECRRSHWDGEQLASSEQVTTDEEGHYAVDGAPAGGTLRLTASIEGRVPIVQTFRAVEGGRDDCDFQFGAASSVTGSVFDLATGAAVEGAELRIQNATVTSSRADGSFDFEQEADEPDAYWISVVAPDYCETRVKWTAELAAAGAFRVPLLSGARIEGHVRHSDGTPAGALQLMASSRNRRIEASRYPLYPAGLSLQFRSSEEARRSTTRADGSFAFTGILAGERDAKVYLSDRDRGYAEPASASVAAPGGTSTVDLTLETTGTVRGIVQTEGEPASAQVHWSAEQRRGTGRTNDGGEFLMRGVPLGEVLVRATPIEGDGVQGGADTSAANSIPLQVEAEPEAWIELELEDPNERVEGLVVDAHGNPASGVEVYAWAHHEESGTYAQAEDSSDAEGRFSLSVPTMPIPYELYADDGARSASLSGVVPGSTGVELMLSDSGTLALRVVDALSEDAIRKYELYARAADDEQFRRRGARGGTVPDPAGFVEFELPSGTFELCVVARHDGYRDERIQAVTVPPAGGRVEERAALSSGTNVVVEFVPASEGIPELEGSVLLLGEGQEKPRSRWSNDLGRIVWQYQEVSPGRGGKPGRARGLEPGPHRFVAHRADWEFDPAVIEVPQVDEHHVRVTYRPKTEEPAEGPAPGLAKELEGLGYFGDF